MIFDSVDKRTIVFQSQHPEIWDKLAALWEQKFKRLAIVRHREFMWLIFFASFQFTCLPRQSKNNRYGQTR